MAWLSRCGSVIEPARLPGTRLERRHTPLVDEPAAQANAFQDGAFLAAFATTVVRKGVLKAGRPMMKASLSVGQPEMP